MLAQSLQCWDQHSRQASRHSSVPKGNMRLEVPLSRFATLSVAVSASKAVIQAVASARALAESPDASSLGF